MLAVVERKLNRYDLPAVIFGVPAKRYRLADLDLHRSDHRPALFLSARKHACIGAVGVLVGCPGSFGRNRFG